MKDMSLFSWLGFIFILLFYIPNISNSSYQLLTRGRHFTTTHNLSCCVVNKLSSSLRRESCDSCAPVAVAIKTLCWMIFSFLNICTLFYLSVWKIFLSIIQCKTNIRFGILAVNVVANWSTLIDVKKNQASWFLDLSMYMIVCKLVPLTICVFVFCFCMFL